MSLANKNLSILSEAEQAALYELPDFDDAQRLTYLNFNPEEMKLIYSRQQLSTKIYCALLIGYFKAKQLFFKFSWDEVEDDVSFIIQEYFPDQDIQLEPISKHQHYALCSTIADFFDYNLWSKKHECLLYEQACQILRRDINPQFIVIELLSVLRENKIMRPRYTTLQTIVSQVLNTERKRLATIIQESLTEQDKKDLELLLLNEKEDVLSGLAELKQSAKDFKARMISAEREKLLSIKSLFQLTKLLLPKLGLSQQNIQYYSSLVDYYTIYDLRTKIKMEQSHLYLLCYINSRYHHLNDNLMDAFCYKIKQCEDAIKSKTKEEHALYALNQQKDLSTMRSFARLFISNEISNETKFGDVRKKAFATILAEDKLRNKVSDGNDGESTEMDFKWKAVDALFHRYKLQLRPLVLAIDFSSSIEDSPWFLAIEWLKESLGTNKKTRLKIAEAPRKTIPEKIRRYFIKGDSNGLELNIKRYEFWIYRQLRKRLKSGEIFVEDSIQHRSLQQEISIAHEKRGVIENIDIPALNMPIKELLDIKLEILDTEWVGFNQQLSKGHLKHLFFDEKLGVLHLKKLNNDKDEEIQHRFYEHLPMCDITDVLKFVNDATEYSSSFTHIQPRYSKTVINEGVLSAAIIAQACNSGNFNMAEISDISYDMLSDVYQSRLRLQTLKKANDKIGESISEMPIFSFYPIDMAILYGGVDGQKFEVEKPTLKARHSKKYFKKGKGVVAYTLLVNHIPLQTELIGAHEHESYFAFDIWYNNTSSVTPDAITGDMHLINKANFAIMDLFGGNLCPRFTTLQTQVKHLYSSSELNPGENWLINPVGKIDRELIENEWHNILSIVKALACKEITQSILIEKLCNFSTANRTRKALFEYDKLIRSIYTLKYFQSAKLQRDIHRSQNRVESYHQLRSAIAAAYGRKQLSGRGEREIEISNQCGRLVANAIIHYNSAILSKLKQKYETENNNEALEVLKKISPVAWQHINFHGHLNFTKNKTLDLDEIIKLIQLGDENKDVLIKVGPEISGVCG